jgi:hypothetical protein
MASKQHGGFMFSKGFNLFQNTTQGLFIMLGNEERWKTKLLMLSFLEADLSGRVALGELIGSVLGSLAIEGK